MIPCEGSDQTGHAAFDGTYGPNYAMCAMCGRLREQNPDGTMAAHDRMDILAMIDRGDFKR